MTVETQSPTKDDPVPTDVLTNEDVVHQRHCDIGVIYYHLKLSVVQTPRLFNPPSKSYSKTDVPNTSGDDLMKESK